jgi:lysozyme family protein
MRDNFDLFFEKAIEHEGRVCEDVPGDAGGPTKWGITLGRLATIKRVPEPRRGTAAFDKLKAELYALSEDEIKQIYRRDYWDAVRGDDLPAGVDYCVADFGLNSGPSRAVKYLQKQMGTPQTGKMDDKTIEEVSGHHADDVIIAYCTARTQFLKSIVENRPSQGKFLRGWLSRVKDVQATSLTMYDQAPHVAEPLAILPKAVAPEIGPTWTKTAVKSKSFWINTQAILWAIVAPIVGLFQWIVDTVSSFAGIVPDVKEDVNRVMEIGSQVAGYLQLNVERITYPLLVTALIVVTYRHVRDKKDMSQ